MDEILDFVAIEPLNKIVVQQPIYQNAVRKVTGLSNETISKFTTIACKLFIQLTYRIYVSLNVVKLIFRAYKLYCMYACFS